MTAGEEWAAAELRQLRGEHFTPRAWVRFITRSLDRAADARAAQPELTRQARQWSAAGLLAGIGVTGLGHAPRRQVAGFAGWWLAVALMLDWHLGMLEGPAGEQREQLSAADALTLARLWIVPFLAAADQPATFTTLIATAGISDTLDGTLARRHGPTRLGRDLDKTSDVAIMLAAAHSAGNAGWLTMLVARLLQIRGAIPIAAVTASYFLNDQRPRENEYGNQRRMSPALTAGLALAPWNGVTGNTLVAIAAVGALTTAARARKTQTFHRCAPPTPAAGCRVPSLPWKRPKIGAGLWESGRPEPSRRSSAACRAMASG